MQIQLNTYIGRFTIQSSTVQDTPNKVQGIEKSHKRQRIGEKVERSIQAQKSQSVLFERAAIDAAYKEAKKERASSQRDERRAKRK